MGLRYIVAALTDVPEAQRSLYVQKDGKYVLDVDGVVESTMADSLRGDVKKFRDTNIELLKALGASSPEDGLKRAALFAGIDSEKLEKLKAIDPDEFDKLKQKAAKLKDKGVSDADDLEGKFKAMLDAALAPYKTQLETEKNARIAAQEKADKALLRQVVGDKLVKAGGRPDAIDFLMEKAPFRVDGDKVTAKENQYSSANPGKLIEVDEWLTIAAKEFPFAFEKSQGGGAGPSSGPGSNLRPGVQRLVNPTPQELGRNAAAIAKGEMIVVSQ